MHQFQKMAKNYRDSAGTFRTFKNHPFKVRMDQEMIRLSASVEKYGIINPLIVRPIPDGVYDYLRTQKKGSC